MMDVCVPPSQPVVLISHCIHMFSLFSLITFHPDCFE